MVEHTDAQKKAKRAAAISSARHSQASASGSTRARQFRDQTGRRYDSVQPGARSSVNPGDEDIQEAFHKMMEERGD